MASSSSVNLKALGLNFSPNALELPPGSLVEADNIIIRRDDVIESRRGFKLFGEEMPSQEKAKQLMVYRDRILRHYGSKLAFQDGENGEGVAQFTEFAGTYSETQDGLRIKGVQEKNGNFYFTTSSGIKKISAASGSELSPESDYITAAGGIKALDLEAKFRLPAGTETGFLPPNSVTSYKLVWGKTDANNVEVLGRPSEEVIVYNPLRTLLVLNLNNLLYILDKFTTTDALFKYAPTKSLFSTLAAKADINAADLRQKLVDLAKKLDEDEVFASDSGSGVAYNPLGINTVTASSGIITTVFDAGTPSNYFSTDITSPKNINVYLDGFKSNGVDIDNLNGAQEIQTVSDTPTKQITFTARGYSASDSVGVSGGITEIPTTRPLSSTVTVSTINENFTYAQITGCITVANTATITKDGHSLIDGDIIVITSGVGSFTAGEEYYVVNSIKGDTFQLATSAGATAVSQGATAGNISIRLKFIFNENDKVRINSTQDYPRYLPSSPISGSINSITKANTTTITTTTAHGLSSGDTIIISGSNSVPSVDGNHVITYVSSTQFTIPVNVNNTAGTTGTWQKTIALSSTQSYYSIQTTTGQNFKLSLTSGGSALDFVYAGTGIITAKKVTTIPITTSGLHGLKDLQKVKITNSSCYPTIDGEYIVTVLSDTKFSIEKDIEIQTAGTSGQWNIVVDTRGEIQSNKYRLLTPEPETPAETDFTGTGKVLFSYQTYLESILNTLKLEDNNVIKKDTAKTLGLTDFEQESSGVVDLKFTVPKEIDSSYYYQLYRSSYFQVGLDSVTSLEQAEPQTDFTLLRQDYYTTTDKVLSITDDQPEEFLTGAFLYTNTGEAGNDYPPIAKDVASFKGKTFYANAKIKQQFLLELIGVAQLKDEIAAGRTPKLLFADSSGSNTCEVSFVLAAKEVSTIASPPAASATAIYFDINSANDETKYRFWYGTDVALAPDSNGKTLVQINITGASTPEKRAQAISDTVNLYITDFEADVYHSTITGTSGSAIISSTNSLTDGDKVKFIGNYLPDGIAEDIEYFVINRTSSSFKV